MLRQNRGQDGKKKHYFVMVDDVGIKHASMVKLLAQKKVRDY